MISLEEYKSRYPYDESRRKMGYSEAVWESIIMKDWIQDSLNDARNAAEGEDFRTAIIIIIDVLEGNLCPH